MASRQSQFYLNISGSGGDLHGVQPGVLHSGAGILGGAGSSLHDARPGGVHGGASVGLHGGAGYGVHGAGGEVHGGGGQAVHAWTIGYGTRMLAGGT